MQIHKVIADNVPKINTIHFMPRRDPVPSMHTHGHTHVHPQGPDNSKNFAGSKQKLSLREKSEGDCKTNSFSKLFVKHFLAERREERAGMHLIGEKRDERGSVPADDS